MTQRDAVLTYLGTHGSITPMEAFSELGITKLATVVSRMIRVEGMRIKKTPVTLTTRYGRPTTFMKYSLDTEATDG